MSYTNAHYHAAYCGGQAAKRLAWIRDANYSNVVNRELFPYWEKSAIEYAIAAMHEARIAQAIVDAADS